MADTPSGYAASSDILAEIQSFSSGSGLLAELFELGSHAVSAHRVGLWMMEPADSTGEDTSRILQRVHLYTAASGSHTSGGLLQEERFPGYFRALDSDDLLVVDDVASDPRTAELVKPYARPLGIHAWIDQRIRLPDGRLALVRFERGGRPRRWKPGEVRMARAVAAAVRSVPYLDDPSDSSPPDDEPQSRDSQWGRDFRRLTDHARIAALRLDSSGTITDCSTSFANLVHTGSPDEIEGRPIQEFLVDDREAERLVRHLRDLDTLPLRDLRLRTPGDGEAWVVLCAVRSAEPDAHMALMVDITDRKNREQELRRQAHFDALTDLPNRRLFWHDAPQLLALADRHGRAAAVAYLDLCNFKGINDRYGHPAGDEVLATVAERFEGQLRESDIGARIGGDEFAALLSEVEGQEAALEAIRRIVENLNRPVTVEGETIEVRVRAGIAIYPDHGTDLEQLIENADEAMYRAASEEEPAFTLYQPSEAVDIPRVRHETRALKRALRDDEFVLHYQPILSLPDRAFEGVEALVRWQHPRSGLLYPSAFLSDAREAGLLADIDRWVLRRATHQVEEWKDRSGPRWVSVNLSRASLEQPARLIQLIEERLETLALDPGRLVLELNAAELHQADPTDIRPLASLQELGIRLAADCRGAGPAALAAISDLSFDFLKLTLEALDDEQRPPGGIPFPEFLIEPGGQLLAERLETESDFLEACEASFVLGQGYYLSRPSPEPDVASSPAPSSAAGERR